MAKYFSFNYYSEYIDKRLYCSKFDNIILFEYKLI